MTTATIDEAGFDVQTAVDDGIWVAWSPRLERTARGFTRTEALAALRDMLRPLVAYGQPITLRDCGNGDDETLTRRDDLADDTISDDFADTTVDAAVVRTNHRRTWETARLCSEALELGARSLDRGSLAGDVQHSLSVAERIEYLINQ